MLNAQHLITRQQAAGVLEMSLRNFDRIRVRGEIAAVIEDGDPHKRGRRYLRFDLGEVLQWKREHREAKTAITAPDDSRETRRP